MQRVNHPANPFPGLRPFEPTETHLFFGRDGQSEELVRRLRRTRFLAVVGASGSGKSSLVRAGLLPALQGGLMASAGSDWRIAIMRPGDDPLGNLALALASPAVLGPRGRKDDEMAAVLAETTLRRSSLGLLELVERARARLDESGSPLFRDYENLLVVVDQFEELFRFKRLIAEGKSQEDAAAFVKLLLEAVRPREGKIYVVLTMRSDFLGDCSQFWELPEAINNGQYLIPRMTRDERREAITGPVAVGGGSISDPLINQLLNDAGDNPDQLPIMQHALMRTWDCWVAQRRNGEPMDIPHYQAIGGMGEALSHHADEAYGELDEAQKVIAESLFKGLTERGADNREVRRPLEVREICDLTGAGEAAVVAVVEVFRREGRSFLMPPPSDPLTGSPIHLTRESLIDISHESLIRNWERLKAWVDEESRSARIYRRLAETAVLHEEGGAGLWRDPDLQVALSWRETSRPNQAWARRYHPEFTLAMEFLDDSVKARDAQFAAEEARRRREIKRTRLTALVFAVAFFFSLAMGVYAYGKQKTAEEQQLIAVAAKEETERALAVANQQREMALSAQKEVGVQRDAALRAQEVADTRAEEATLSSEAAKRSAEAAEEALRAAEAAKNEARVNEKKASERERQALAAEKKASEREEEARAAAKEAINQIGKNRRFLYSSNISVAQKALEDNNSERAQKLLEGLIPDPSKAFGITVSDMKLWEDMTDLRGFEWHYLWGLAARRLASFEPGESAGPPPAWAVPGTSPELPAQHRPLGVVKYGRSWFATVGKNNVVSVWKPNRLERPVATLPAGTARVSDIAWIGGSTLVTAEPAAVKFWRIRQDSVELERTIELKGGGAHTAVASYGFDADFLPAIGTNTAFMLWDWRTEQFVTLAEGRYKYPSVVFLAQGRFLITCDGQKLTRWDVLTRQSSEIKLLGDEGRRPLITSISFTLDGKTMVTNGPREFLVWGAANAEQTAYELKAKLPAHKQPALLQTLYDLVTAISPDGKLLATGDGTDLKNGGGVKLWDITGERPKELFTLSPGVEYATSLAFTRDGRTLIVGGRGAVQLWDVGEKVISSSLGLTSTAAPAVFAPGGDSFVTADEHVVRWLVPALEVRDDAEWDDMDSSERRPDSMIFLTDMIKGTPVALSPGGEIVATHEGKGGALRLWDGLKGDLRATIKGDVWGEVAFSPDKKSVATASSVSIVEWWNTSGDQSRTPQPRVETSKAAAMAFSPDGKMLAVGGGSDEASQGLVTLWNAASKEHEQLGGVGGHEGVDVVVTSLAFSPNSEILATGGSDKKVELWNVYSEQLIATLEGHTSPVSSVAYSPDGKTIASGDLSGKVNLWSAVTHQLLLTLNVSSSPVKAIAFSPSGKTLFTNDLLGEVRRWIAAKRD